MFLMIWRSMLFSRSSVLTFCSSLTTCAWQTALRWRSTLWHVWLEHVFVAADVIPVMPDRSTGLHAMTNTVHVGSPIAREPLPAALGC